MLSYTDTGREWVAHYAKGNTDMYTEQEALRIAEAAAIRGMQQGLDAGFALAARNTPIGSTRARITGIIDTLRKEGYLRAETAVRA